MLTKKEQKQYEEARFLELLKKYPALFDNRERCKSSSEERHKMWIIFAKSLPGQCKENV